jgi:hypothetical protein
MLMNTQPNARAEPETFRLAVVGAGTGDPSSTRMLAGRLAGRAAALAAGHGNAVAVSAIDLRGISVGISSALVSQLGGPKLHVRLPARRIRAESWHSYQHESGSAAEGAGDSIDLGSDLMRLAAGGSAT